MKIVLFFLVISFFLTGCSKKEIVKELPESEKKQKLYSLIMTNNPANSLQLSYHYFNLFKTGMKPGFSNEVFCLALSNEFHSEMFFRFENVITNDYKVFFLQKAVP